MAATFLLVGGEAYEWQGVAPEQREFQHTSVEFIGSAYTSLRAAGVPRDRIITVVQLNDYLSTIARGEKGEMAAITGIPAKWYAEQRERTEGRCRLLIDEGGATYDNGDVNPATVWSILLGEAIPGTARPVVPPLETGPIVFGIYSHGDCHPAGDGTAASEWFAHFPYESSRSDIYEYVATQGAEGAGVGKNRPHNYLYATQLRLIFHQILQRTPDRPIIGLLNYCLSGGNLEFMRRDSVRQHLQVDKWPLFLMSSSQAKQESMVAGMWEAWFQQLKEGILNGAPGMTIGDLFLATESAYYQENLYEFLNAVKARVYVPLVWQCKFSFPGKADDSVDPWHLDLQGALQRTIPQPGTQFSFDAVRELQRAYGSGEAYSIVRKASLLQWEALRRVGGAARDGQTGHVVVWMYGDITPDHLRGMQATPLPVQLVEYSGTSETGRCQDLASVVQLAVDQIARPDEVHGHESGIAKMALSTLFGKL